MGINTHIALYVIIKGLTLQLTDNLQLMARKYISFFALTTALAVLMSVSCKPEVIPDDPVDDPTEKPEDKPEDKPEVDGTITLTCSLESDPEAKVDISDAGKVTWKPGDAILIHGQGESNRTVVNLTADNISADGKTATISVSGITPYDRSSDGVTSTIYAAYPAEAIPDIDLWWYSTFKNTNCMLMAGYNVGNKLQFRNLCGLLTFTVNGDYDSYEFSGNNGETVGYGTYEVKLVICVFLPASSVYSDGFPILL